MKLEVAPDVNINYILPKDPITNQIKIIPLEDKDLNIGDIVVNKKESEDINKLDEEIQKTPHSIIKDALNILKPKREMIENMRSHLYNHICVIVGKRKYYQTAKFKLKNILNDKLYDIDFTSDQLLKLELVNKPNIPGENESTGGKRKTIRRKSKNRKTKKKINGGRTYSNEEDEIKRKDKLYNEGEEHKAITRNQEEEQRRKDVQNFNLTTALSIK